MQDLRERLRSRLKGRVCFVGLGNPDFGDDGFGVRLAESLAQSLAAAGSRTSVTSVFIAGATPERYIGHAAVQEYEHLVFLDAVEFGGVPGSAVLLNSEQMAARFPQLSTHKISLALLSVMVEAGGATKAWLLGVQPGSLGAGQGLSRAVRQTSELLIPLLGEMTGQC